MKISFVYPRFPKFLDNNPDLDRGLIDYFLGDFTTPPSLGIPIMASLTPPDVEIELLDDNSGDRIDYAAPTDLVAINCFTPQATRAFEIADEFRRYGKKIIMGGFFPSFMVDECLKHADSVNVGEVEPTWEAIVADARTGNLKCKYIGGCRFDLSKMKIPRRDIFYSKESYDWDEDLVQVTRGCLYNCAMCAIPAHMGNRIRFRPINQVVEEIKTLRYENVYLADDTLFFPHRKINEYARELFKSLAPLGKKYFVSSTMALNIDPEFLDLAARAGVANFYCTMNVDPLSIKALQGGVQERRMLVDLVTMLRDRGMRFFGSCALGRDWDDLSIADRILDLFAAADIHTAEFFIFTAYPGSAQWDKLERQNRIIDKTWAHYNGAHVVSRPLNMTPDQLYGQFIKVWNEFFRAQKKSHGASLEPATYRDGKQVVGKPLRRKAVKGQAVITGIGVLSPLGNDAETITAALRAGKSGLGSITRFDPSPFRLKHAGEIRGFDAHEMLNEHEIDDYDDTYLQYAVTAARKAMRDAGIAFDATSPRSDIALVLATCNGGLLSAEAEYAWKHGKGDKEFDAKMNLQAQYYGLGKAIAHALGISGEAWVVTTACSSATAALGIAQNLIARGYYSRVLVGAADALCVANVSGFDALKATSATLTAPFSLPAGLNIGEGACFWVVEDMEAALLRQARCLGKIAGHATTCDAYHPTSPDPRGDGAYRTILAALNHAGLAVTDIGCINAHGTGTEANDRAESKGIARLIGTNPVPAVSTKSFFGHCMGVTGLLEATGNLFAMNAGFIPPTINFSEPRPGCTLDYVPNTARECRYNAFASANYAFGGNNAAVAITSWDHDLTKKNQEFQRVVITGTGTVTSLGLGIGPTLDALRREAIGLSSVERLKLTGLKSKLAGLVREFKSADVDRRLDISQLSPIAKYAVAAAKLALDNAGLAVRPRTSEEIGIAMGVCNGPSEMEHMDAVFSSNNFAANINCFSNIVANSTAGWVANALMLKGVNISLAPGHHAGLQSLAYAFDALSEGRAKAILASASDEVYAQTYFNYDLIGYLYPDPDERDFHLRFDNPRLKVLGEGAATLVMESLPAARERQASILAEVLGYGMSMDAAPFGKQGLDPQGLSRAIDCALKRSGAPAAAIDLVVWAPQGNAQDKKVLQALEMSIGPAAASIPLMTTTFNTGYIESASILVSLAAALEAAKSGTEFWPQRTGVDEIDGRKLNNPPKIILALGSSDVGYNFAALLSREAAT
jgi:3-oxoacyl-[acyl-carrier-protein] synthase II